MNKQILLGSTFLILILMMGCSGEGPASDRLHFEPQGREVPSFNADSAYYFIEQQVAFGPRNPGSEGHQKTEEYLLEKLQSHASAQSVYPQNFSVEGYGGDNLALTNIIAAFNPEQNDRIMLCAHWDTRPRADQDSTDPNKPILGADDGGSGVGVLLELARIFEENPPPVGVDIVLFDGEDYGREGDTDNYFLGSRYWSENPPVQGYSPRFSILLDIVGGKGAKFPKEQYSMKYAPALVNELWTIADEKNSQLFLNQEGNAVSDDHVIINRNIGIPTINIINHAPTDSGAEFPSYWHTHDDNMEIISRETLGGVGRVLTELIYNRIEVEE